LGEQNLINKKKKKKKKNKGVMVRGEDKGDA